MPIKTRSQTTVFKKFYDWVFVDTNAVEKPFAGKEYDDAAARRESNRASNISSTPKYKTVTEKKLAELGLTPDSRDPTGKYKIVIASFKLGIELGYNCNKKGKWAIAPPGYCWHEFSDSDYYNYDWYALCKIVTPEEKEEKERKETKEKEEKEEKEKERKENVALL